MKKQFISAICLIFALALTGCSESVVSPVKDMHNLTPGEKQIVKSSAQFGLKLFREVNKTEGEKNIFISPLSVSTAISMVLNGAKGTTYDDIKATLSLSGGTQEEVNAAYSSLNNLLIKSDPKVIFESANSIWYRRGFQFEQNFLETNKKYFNAEVSDLDFENSESVGTINNWVKEKTKDKISKIIDYIPQDIVMYLINAIYFKGTWKYRFNTGETVESNFNVNLENTVQCKMMNQKNYFNYFGNKEYQAIELPYGNGNYNMLVILPSEAGNTDLFIEQINDNFWNTLLTGLVKTEVNFLMPKFKVEFGISLKDALSIMGMEIAFDPNKADFSGMRRKKDVFISEVLHKTFVDVNEEGTEAAAVTSVSVGTTSVGPKQDIYMVVDHPFVFAIYEKNSGTILFIGKIINPVQL